MLRKRENIVILSIVAIVVVITSIFVGFRISGESFEEKYAWQANQFKALCGTLPKSDGYCQAFRQPHIHFAAQWGLDAVVQSLIEQGANIEALNHKNASPLVVANYASAKVLIEAGAEVNRYWPIPGSPDGNMTTVMLLQTAMPWKEEYTYMKDPEGDAVKKIQLLLDSGAKLQYTPESYQKIALLAGNRRISHIFRDMVKKK